MHCAHVRLERYTVNTCRLCLGQTRSRMEVERVGLATSNKVCSMTDWRF
jgi:hypothetical protein